MKLSLLFCSSTFLTEWISSCKVSLDRTGIQSSILTAQYPSYSVYRKLVGQFLPQETAILWLWAKLTGKRETLEKDLYRDQEDVQRRKKQS
jgi:hypothetical protein